MMVSVIIPAAEEGYELYHRIGYLYSELKKLATEGRISYEVILVTDVFHVPTLKAMARLSREGVARGLLSTKRIGKGGAVKNAVPYARGHYLVVLDADIPIKPAVIHNAVTLAVKGGLDLLIVNRVYRTHGLLRRLLSTAYNGLVNLLFRTGIRDHQAGFKVLSRTAAEMILVERVRTDGLAYDTELVVWAKRLGLKTATLNVVWREQREGSTIPPLRAVLTMLADLIALRLLTLSGKHKALRKLPVGKIIDLADRRVIGQEFITMIEASGPKRVIFAVFRKLYVAAAFKRP